jgi:hypothetical protein
MSESIAAQVVEIQNLSVAELRERWRGLFGKEAPAYSREHLVRRLAYRVQELAHGGRSCERSPARMDRCPGRA